jgi:hypothetical protein
VKLQHAALIGGILGCLYGVTLWASLDAFSFASWILYGNEYIIPFLSTGVITGIALLLFFSWNLWYYYAERFVFGLIEPEVGEE